MIKTFTVTTCRFDELVLSFVRCSPADYLWAYLAINHVSFSVEKNISLYHSAFRQFGPLRHIHFYLPKRERAKFLRHLPQTWGQRTSWPNQVHSLVQQNTRFKIVFKNRVFSISKASSRSGHGQPHECHKWSPNLLRTLVAVFRWRFLFAAGSTEPHIRLLWSIRIEDIGKFNKAHRLDFPSGVVITFPIRDPLE